MLHIFGERDVIILSYKLDYNWIRLAYDETKMVKFIVKYVLIVNTFGIFS